MIYETITSYLEKHPEARERRNKNESLVKIILSKYGHPQTDSELVDFCMNFNSYDRLWRQVLQENPTLRGFDYDTKDIVEQDKVLSLGYQMRYNEDKRVMEKF